MRLVNHSDAPAAVLWPWWGMEASITRGFPRKPEIEKMGPEHALTLEEMIVLNHNLFEIPETDIHKTEVQETIFKGEVVYESN